MITTPVRLTLGNVSIRDAKTLTITRIVVAAGEGFVRADDDLTCREWVGRVAQALDNRWRQ